MIEVAFEVQLVLRMSFQLQEHPLPCISVKTSTGRSTVCELQAKKKKKEDKKAGRSTLALDVLEGRKADGSGDETQVVPAIARFGLESLETSGPSDPPEPP